MDRFSWAIAAAALVLFAGLVVVASVMKSPTDTPGVSCTGSSTCQTVPRPIFTDNPVPLPRSSQLP